MESLLLEFQLKISQISLEIQRYLVHQIDLNNRLIAIKGARGSGKTTLKTKIYTSKNYKIPLILLLR